MRSVLHIDDYDLREALQVASTYGSERFGYVVTPNVDHVIRHHRDKRFRALYEQAAFVLLDSRFLSHTVGLVKRQVFRVCLGSDLTTEILCKVARPSDVVVLVGGSVQQAQLLRDRFGLKRLHHIDPPMNFIDDSEAVESCLRTIEQVGPFRFCFLAVGSPQQEIIAQMLKERGHARGLALCVGAAINYLTGIERRAPQWMQRTGFEWLFRLLQNPRRMAKRYLVRGPIIFLLLWKIEFRVRKSPVSSEPTISSATAIGDNTVPIL